MPKKPTTQKQLVLELEDLRARLDEAEETLRAIRSGEVDALIVSGVGGEQVFTLKGADHSYRTLIEDMNEGALTLTAEGVILYANRRFAEMLKTPLEKVIGSTIYTWVAPDSQKNLQVLLRGDDTKTRRRGEVTFIAGDGTLVPVYLFTNVLQTEEMQGLLCMVATDPTEQKRTGAIAASEKLARELPAASSQSRLELLREIEDRKRAEETLKKSEILYRTFIDASNDMIFLKDEMGRYSIVNKGYLEYLGKKEEDVIGKTGFEIRPLQIAEQCDQSDRETLKLNDIVVSEETANDRTIETKKFPVRLGENKTGIGGFMRDITENKLAAKRLLESEERYRDLFENAAEGIYQSTFDGRLITVNPAFAKMLGFDSPDEAIAKLTDVKHQVYVNPEDRESMKQKVGQYGSISGFETQFYRKDGTKIWVHFSMRGIRDTRGILQYYEGVVEDITSRKHSEEELKVSTEKLRKSLVGTIHALSVTVETRDPYTAGHQKKVSRLARTIAQEMGLPKDTIEHIRMAGTIHDLGKIAVPAEILSKPTKLTDVEFSLIKVHPQSGYDILKDVDLPYPIAEIVYQHHERLDGSGYPRGLKDGQILLGSCILAVADVVEAMASHRPYRPAMGIDVALEDIEKNAGILYDRETVEVCLKLFREKQFSFE